MNFQEELLKSLRLHGNRVAIENGSNQLSYAQLLQGANKITGFLSGHNLNKETLIGINLDGKPEIIMTMIGVMNARCSFVLLDHNLPDDRLATMIRDMKLAHVITCGDRWIDFRIKKKFPRNRTRNNSQLCICYSNHRWGFTNRSRSTPTRKVYSFGTAPCNVWFCKRIGHYHLYGTVP